MRKRQVYIAVHRGKHLHQCLAIYLLAIRSMTVSYLLLYTVYS